MIMRTTTLVASCLLVLIGVAWASGDWNKAKSRADDYKTKRDELRRTAAEETKKLVAAACVADKDQRSNADNAASNARSRVADKFNDLERIERDAVDLLEHVIGDDALKSNRDEARTREQEIKSSWDRIKDSTRQVRERSRDIVDGFIRDGESAIHSRVDRCDAKDVSLNAGHAQCLMASGGDTCKVIEYAPDDSQAISRARDRAQRFKSNLEQFDANTVRHLIDRKSDFAKCKHYEVRVDCYRACPDVSDDGEIRSRSTSWREGC